MQWGISRSSFIALSYFILALVYGVHVLRSLLGNAEVCDWPFSMLAGKFGCHRNNITWMAVPSCLMWCIQWERNSWCFEDPKRKIIDLNFSFLERHSISLIYDLMDARNLCSWLSWSTVVYVVYTWVTLLMFE